MLEQAIIDAAQLRDVALKSAETAVVEKYANEVREAVEKLLEEDPLGDPFAAEDDELESDVVVDIPMAHDPEVAEDEVVVLDLDQIIAAAEADEGIEDETFELDAEEVAAEVGIPLDSEDPADEVSLEPGNRSDTDDLDLSEHDLLDLFKELLVVDVDKKRIEQVEEEAEETKQEEREEEEVTSIFRDDGFDLKDSDTHRESIAKLELEVKQLNDKNNQLKNILAQAKDRLQEINLSNARLLYTNRVLEDTSLNEQQKKKIAEMISGTRSVDETKMVFETLQKTLASTPIKRSPQSLSEAVSKKSSVILGGQRQNQNNPSQADPTKSRWATLAGIGNKT